MGENILDAMSDWHGTINGYTNHSCRCDLCKKAWAEYRSQYRARNRERDLIRIRNYRREYKRDYRAGKRRRVKNA